MIIDLGQEVVYLSDFNQVMIVNEIKCKIKLLFESALPYLRKTDKHEKQ